jgi:hypothetical protein
MMNKDKVQLIHDTFEVALKSFSKNNKWSITIGNASFTNNDVKLEIEVTELGTMETPVLKDFCIFAWLYGLVPEDFAATFTYAGKQYKLVEIYPTRPKVLGEDTSNLLFKMVLFAHWHGVWIN